MSSYTRVVSKGSDRGINENITKFTRVGQNRHVHYEDKKTLLRMKCRVEFTTADINSLYCAAHTVQKAWDIPVTCKVYALGMWVAERLIKQICKSSNGYNLHWEVTRFKFRLWHRKSWGPLSFSSFLSGKNTYTSFEINYLLQSNHLTLVTETVIK